MRSIFRIQLLLAAIAFVFVSCQDEESFDLPTISVTSEQIDENNTFTGKNDETLSFTIEIVADAGINLVNAELQIDGNTDQNLFSFSPDASESPTSFTSDPITLEILSDYLDKEVYIQIEATDSKNQSNTLNIAINADGKYASGVFILNEGNFTSSNGSISFLNIESVLTNNIFYEENDKDLGDVVQSMTILDSIAFLIINNSNKIEVVNAKTFELITTIQADQPRYLEINGDKGYLTEQPSGGGHVRIIDMANYETLATIETGDFSAPNTMIIKENTLYVSHSYGNSLSVIDLTSESITATIEVGNGPGDLVMDQNGDIWVICAGGYGTDWSALNDGALVRLSSDNLVAEKIELNTNLPGKLGITEAGTQLFFLINNTVNTVDLTATTKSASVFVTIDGGLNLYGLGVNPENGDIYVGDAVYFQGNGTVFQYSANASLIDSYEVGVGPNGFVFN